MAHLTEKDYSELIDYMIDKLRTLQADDVIRQIQDLEKVNVLEKAGPLKVDVPDELAAKSTTWNFPNQIGIDQYEIENSRILEYSPKKPDKKLVKEAVSEYRLRPMTSREMCRAATDILESYLITVPSIIEMTKKALELGPDERVFWAIEAARSSEADYIDIEQFIQQAPESRKEMEALIAALRADL